MTTEQRLRNALRLQRARWETMGGPYSGPAIRAIDEVLGEEPDLADDWAFLSGVLIGDDRSLEALNRLGRAAVEWEQAAIGQGRQGPT